MVSPASPLRDTASRTLPPTWYRCSTPSTSSGLFWRAIRAHVSSPGESLSIIQIESQGCSSKRLRRRSETTRGCSVSSSLSSRELDDPISPEFARSFVVDTSSANVAPDLVDVLVEDILAVPARVWKQTFAGLLEYDDQTELPLIDASTLLVWGDADALVSQAMQDQLAGAIPDAEFLVYPGVGHTPRWDDPVRFSNDLLTFVRRVAHRP